MSDDGGFTWKRFEFPENLKIVDIWAFDSENWLASGKNDLLMRTNNAGKEWQILRYDSASSNNNYSLYFIDSLNGWSARSYGTYRTFDGGLNWIEINSESHPMTFLDENTGYGVDWDYVYKTTDGGHSFTIIYSSAGENTPVRLHAVSKDTIYLSTGLHKNWGAPAVRFSTDGGNSWTFTNYTNGHFPVYGISHNKKGLLFGGSWGYLGRSKIMENIEALNGDFLTSVYAFDDIVFIAGYGGFLYKGSRYGSEWEKIDLGYLPSHSKLLFENRKVGYLISPTKLFRTTDGGSKWDDMNINFFINWTDRSFIDPAGNIYLTSTAIMKSTDHGQTWSQIEFPPHFSSGRLFIYDSLHFWGLASETIINLIATTNGGQNWDILLQNYLLFNFEFFSPDSGIAAFNKTFIYTVDAGRTWTPFPGNFPDHYHHLIATKYFNYENSIHVTSDGDPIFEVAGHPFFKHRLYRYSAGIYHEEFQFNSTYGTSISFLDEKNGWVAGGRGLFRIRLDSITNVQEQEPAILNFGLIQNYPNPFNPSTSIKYSLKYQGRVTLSIYNLLGREVIKLVDEEKPAGIYETTWNASSFPSGIYFLRMHADQFSETKKLMLMK
jgi:photosystem II stability/assembly factor-like uncharacterized protein